MSNIRGEKKNVLTPLKKNYDFLKFLIKEKYHALVEG